MYYKPHKNISHSRPNMSSIIAQPGLSRVSGASKIAKATDLWCYRPFKDSEPTNHKPTADWFILPFGSSEPDGPPPQFTFQLRLVRANTI